MASLEPRSPAKKTETQDKSLDSPRRHALKRRAPMVAPAIRRLAEANNGDLNRIKTLSFG